MSALESSLKSIILSKSDPIHPWMESTEIPMAESPGFGFHLGSILTVSNSAGGGSISLGVNPNPASREASTMFSLGLCRRFPSGVGSPFAQPTNQGRIINANPGPNSLASSKGTTQNANLGLDSLTSSKETTQNANLGLDSLTSSKETTQNANPGLNSLASSKETTQNANPGLK
ncbi:hypothetical protein C8J57DRAFT_1541132 [Mycena rebaudengoi]|nr:hypothetical protein C8J57DRAFT_1541132 [Mycena rebaudengoi]